MKLKCATFFLVIFATILMVPANGQISKGDYILDFNPSISTSNFGGSQPRVNINGSYLKMISDRIMVGGEFGVLFAETLTTSSSGTQMFPFNQIYLNPTFRYYFSNAKISPFASFQNEVNIANFSERSSFDDTFRYTSILGLGADYFIGDHVVLEGLLNYNVLELGDSFDRSKSLTLELGVKLLFTDALKKDIDNLADKVYRKGVIETSGNFLFASHRFNEVFKGSFNLSPEVRYFIKDRLSILVGLNYGRFNFAERTDYSYGGTLGLAYTQKIVDDLFVILGVETSLDRDKFGRGTTFERTGTTISIPLSAEFQYFHKQKRVYVGARYTTSSFKISDQFVDDFNRNRLTAFLGLDYFVQENVYFTGELKFLNTNLQRDIQSINTTSLSFGIGFFFSR